MYFWRIEKLKAEMATRSFSDRESLPYLILFVTLYTATMSFPTTSFNFWDGAGAAWSVLLAIFGTIYIYRRNGGANGEQFLQRYFALGWVVSIRLLVILGIATFAFYAALEISGKISNSTSALDFLLFALMEVVIYWRIGHHVGDLAQRKSVT